MHVLIGAHLEEGDLAGTEGITRFRFESLTISAIEMQSPESVASRTVIQRAAAARQAAIAREIFVAIRYGATVRSQQDVGEKVAGHAERWKELLTRCRGKVELTMKVTTAGRNLRPDATKVTSGTEYLEELRRMRAMAPDPRFLAAAEERMGAIAEQSRWTTREDGARELALLVRRSDIPRAKDAGDALLKEFPAVPFLLSGPWPLEVFADE